MLLLTITEDTEETLIMLLHHHHVLLQAMRNLNLLPILARIFLILVAGFNNAHLFE